MATARSEGESLRRGQLKKFIKLLSSLHAHDELLQFFANLKLDILAIFLSIAATMTKMLPGILVWVAILLVESTVAGAMPEYTAAEAKNHIGETARVTDKVDCALANRHGGYNVGLGDCKAQTPFWVVTHGDISGPNLDVSELKGVVITVTGKIDNESGVPRIFVKSTSQIASGSRGKSRGRVHRRKNLARDTDVARPRRSNAAAPLRKPQRA